MGRIARVADVQHLGPGPAMLDQRTYAWDAAYNLEQRQITGGPLVTPAVPADSPPDSQRASPPEVSSDYVPIPKTTRDYAFRRPNKSRLEENRQDP